jgi:membrane protease YdiL (CAAX protease family)
MPAFLKIAIFAAAVVLAGALVAPPVFWAGQAMAESGWSSWLAGFPFHRVLSRCLQISALVLLVPTLWWVGLRRLRELNLQRNPIGRRDLVVGLFVSLLPIALLLVVYVVGGWFVWNPSPEWTKFGRIFLTASVVSVIEEAVFRGVVLGVCLWSLRPLSAIAVSSVFFAVVHFIKPAKTSIIPADVGWLSGFIELGKVTDSLPSVSVLWWGMLSLLLAGWILGSATLRTRSLWLAIGLHAGWILGQQSLQVILRPADGNALASLPWAGPNLVSGAVPTGILPLVAVIAAGWFTHLYLRYVFRPVA